ncbi:LytR/AlgR family response regulator transcription factor [Chondrinema litorale]|uniref:LytR/AlgR family response regulator transcription factor n=1 Tax=Chondrinema litorale TaxID=2994555 RepID=UPI0025429CD5|nr:LytTR family DNA-binding domain-containing protein [Chondrinema litorale]UZR97784.1 LytTR family DNA-binding domain-containing protein [Chondrinema litorale]
MALNIAIVEDEPATARNLEFILQSIDSEIEVMTILPSVAASVKWLKEHQDSCELLFMDIRLSDGLSFEIFEKVKVTLPVIFLTAYNDFALKAFKANGIDYILKPYDEEEVEQALDKYYSLSKGKSSEAEANDNQQKLVELMASIKEATTSYRKSFLVQHRDKLVPLDVAKIGWFYTENELVYAHTFENQKFIVDFTLEQLQQQLDPKQFYRANRQFVINRMSIQDIEFYFNGRLALNVKPKGKEPVIISKAKASEFKSWMDS